MSQNNRAVVSIASRVSTGVVGNSLIEAAFLRLAPTNSIYTIDTVSWTAPGNHPRRTGIELPGDELSRQLAVLTDARERFGGGASLLLAGYMRTSDQVGALAAFLKGPGRSRFDLILDPVLGDEGRLYIPPSTAEAIRDRLVPHARFVMPNLTEAAWLVMGDPTAGRNGIETIDARLKRYSESHGTVLIVKSIPVNATRIALRIYRPGETTVTIEHDRVALSCHGTGDLFSGIVAAALAKGDAIEPSVRLAATLVERTLAREAADPQGLRVHFHAVAQA